MIHIALDRRFIAWREKEGSAIQRLKDPRPYADDIDWKDLQKHRRVVILAEAGSGKTEELRAQAQALASQGSFAFYTTVQNAGIEAFAESLPEAERKRLAGWIASDKPAWFFIDSVDEAKLSKIQLRTALRKVADGIAPGALEAQGPHTVVVEHRGRQHEAQWKVAGRMLSVRVAGRGYDEIAINRADEMPAYVVAIVKEILRSRERDAGAYPSAGASLVGNSRCVPVLSEHLTIRASY